MEKAQPYLPLAHDTLSRYSMRMTAIQIMNNGDTQETLDSVTFTNLC